MCYFYRKINNLNTHLYVFFKLFNEEEYFLLHMLSRLNIKYLTMLSNVLNMIVTNKFRLSMSRNHVE